MKMADRAHAILPNRKPPWWSTQEYGIPMNYGQKPPEATPGGPRTEGALRQADETGPAPQGGSN